MDFDNVSLFAHFQFLMTKYINKGQKKGYLLDTVFSFSV